MVWRLTRLTLVVGWAFCLVVYALPKELRPDWWNTIRRPIEDTLAILKLRPSHAVFSGAEGNWNRHLWAVRFIGTYPDGSTATLEQWPDDMNWDTPMIFFDPLDTSWYRLVGKRHQVRLSRFAATTREQEELDSIRRSSGVRRITRFWCETAHAERDGDAPVSVHLDAFYASKSYKSGKVRMSSARMGFRRCGPGAPRNDWATPPNPPSWFEATPKPEPEADAAKPKRSGGGQP